MVMDGHSTMISMMVTQLNGTIPTEMDSEIIGTILNWNESNLRAIVEGATQPDRCPNEYSAFLYSDTQGCLTTLQSSDGR